MPDQKTRISAIELTNDSMCAILRRVNSRTIDQTSFIQCVRFHFWFETYHTDRVCVLLFSDAWIHSRELCTLGKRIFWLNGPCRRRSLGKTYSWNAIKYVTRLAGPSHVVLQEKATAEELCCFAVREDASLSHSTAISVLCSWETVAHACLTCHGRC